MAQPFTTSNLGETVSSEVKQFLADHEAFFAEHDASVAERDAAVEQILDAAEKHKGDRDGLLAALTLAVQHLNARQVDRKSQTAVWLARLAKISGVAAVALLLVGEVRDSSSVRPPQEVAGQNFLLSSAG